MLNLNMAADFPALFLMTSAAAAEAPLSAEFKSLARVHRNNINVRQSLLVIETRQWQATKRHQSGTKLGLVDKQTS